MEDSFMTMVNIIEDENNLSELVSRVSKGERIVLVTAGEPVAELVPYNGKKSNLRFGLLKGQMKVADDFDQMSDEASDTTIVSNW
jgi:antitoxin (DNA-binding transcriptional repressor) of toxin-antitoxin stability system